MGDRNVVVRDSGSSVVALSLLAVVVIAVLVALFIWQPWNASTPTHGSAATIQGNPGNGTSGGGAGGAH